MAPSMPLLRPRFSWLLQLFVCALFLASPGIAQSLGLKVTPYGASSGSNASYVTLFQLHVVQTSAGKAEMVATGGAPGFDVGLIVGRAQMSAPILGAQLLVIPELFFFYAKFDKTGTARFQFPMPASKGKVFFVQAIQVGVVSQQLVLSLSEGLRVETIAKAPASTAFSRARAITLMKLAYDVYEWKGASGPIKVGQKLTDGFRVIRKIKTPNPKSGSKWFAKLTWPDTQLMVVRNATGDVGVVFRGTDPTSAKDWVSDVMFATNNGFHGGFLLAYSSVAVELTKFLATAVDKNARVFITGHSLGGALAPVAAYHLQPGLALLGVAKNDVITYAFAGPRAMSPAKAKEFGSRVPHHWVVENKDDMVTHVPLPAQGFAHIPRMQVLYPRGAKVVELGANYRSYGVPGPLTHQQSWYLDRLKGYLAMPIVSLSVSSTGYMQLRRTWSGKKNWGLDTVRLYKGNPFTTGALRYSLGAVLGSPLSTPYAKGPSYYIAYVQAYGAENRILSVRGPYTWTRPRLAIGKGTLGLAKVSWTMKDPGRYDYIALYNKDPRQATLLNRLGTVGATTKARSWTTLTRYKRGLWVAYIEREKATQAGKFVAIIGPTK